MSFKISTLCILSFSLMGLSGCQVAKATGKVAALPFKAAYKTGEIAGKSVYYTGKGVYKTGELAGKGVFYTGKGVYKTGEFAAKSVAAVGKGVYYMGTVPVKITDKALDTSARVLSMTTQAVDTGGKILEVTREFKAVELDAELAALEGVKNLLGVFVDVVS